VKRSTSGFSPIPAKMFDRVCWSCANRFIANPLLASAKSQKLLSALTHASMSGGFAQTDTIELIVRPDLPESPSVVTMATPFAAKERAATKSVDSQWGISSNDDVTQDSLCAHDLCRFAAGDQYDLLGLHEIRSSARSNPRYET